MKKWIAIVMAAVMMILSAASLAEMEIPEELTEMLESGAFRPSDVGYPAQPEYTFPYMGLKAALPQALLDRIAAKEVFMYELQGERSEAGDMTYGLITWSAMTEAQRDEELSMLDGDLGLWMEELRLLGMLGAYHTSVAESLDALSGCAEHVKLGESADGRYQYYLSFGAQADDAERAMLREIALTYTDIEPYPDTCGGILGEEPADENGQNAANVGAFSTQDINGNTVDESLFAGKALTLVNVMATWCSPCVGEIPALEQLRQELEAQGVGIAAFVMDARNEDGTLNQEAIDTARLLAERTGAQLPMLVPDETWLSGRLQRVTAFPTTFFVDQDGSIVSDEILGGRSFEEWKDVVDAQLEQLSGAAQ